MYRRTLLATLAFATAAGVARAAPVKLRAADGLPITADLIRAGGKRRGTILLFHQAGSNHYEYETIAPRLAKLGFDTLAIDQRSGGSMWDHRNETMARLGGDPGFGPALMDLEAALAFARADDPGRLIVWGSSYSAALVFLLAARHPDQVAAVLAFSPGEYIGGVDIGAAAAQLRCPVFVTSAASPEEEAAAASLLQHVNSPLRQQYKPSAGVHGSSTLRADRNPAGAEANWQAVTAFLDAVAPPPR